MANDTKLEIQLGSQVRAAGALIFPRSVPFRSLTVLSADDGALFEISVDGGRTFFPMELGDTYELRDPCAELRDGIYARSLLNTVGTVVLYVGNGARLTRAGADTSSSVGIRVRSGSSAGLVKYADVLGATAYAAMHAIKTVGPDILIPATAGILVLTAYRLALSANASLAAAGIFRAWLQSSGVVVGGATVYGLDVGLAEHRWYLPAAPSATALGALDTGWTEFSPFGASLLPGESLRIHRSAALASGELSVWAQYTER